MDKRDWFWWSLTLGMAIICLITGYQHGHEAAVTACTAPVTALTKG